MQQPPQSGSRLYEAETAKEGCDDGVDYFNVTRSKNKKKRSHQIVSQSTTQMAPSKKATVARASVVKDIEPLVLEIPLVHDFVTHSDEDICRSGDSSDSEETFMHGQLDEIDIVYLDPLPLEILTNAELPQFENDFVRATKFIDCMQKCTTGEELFDTLFTLANNGSATGFAITMNRVVRTLLNMRLLATSDVGSTTWAKCKKDGRDKLIKKVFVDAEVGDANWIALTGMFSIIYIFRISLL